MKFKAITSIKSTSEARQIAIDWQIWQSEQSLSYSEVAQWQGYFKTLARKFPELKAEFKENGII